MDKEKILQEYNATLNSLIEKTKFVYSEEFYALDATEQQKYTKDKMATEGHAASLCNLLWGKDPEYNSLSNLFSLGLLCAMFSSGGMWGSSPLPPLPPTPSTPDNEEENVENGVHAI